MVCMCQILRRLNLRTVALLQLEKSSKDCPDEAFAHPFCVFSQCLAPLLAPVSLWACRAHATIPFHMAATAAAATAAAATIG